MRGSIYAVGSTGAGSVSVGNEPRLGHQSRGGGERVSRLSQQMSLGLDGRSFFPSCIVLPRDPACVSSQGSWRDIGKGQSCPWSLLDSAGCAGNGNSHGPAPTGHRLEQDGRSSPRLGASALRNLAGWHSVLTSPAWLGLAMMKSAGSALWCWLRRALLHGA